MRKWIWITFEFEGYHKWAKAPLEVEFLRNKHRHLFKCKIWIEVTDSDREIEFFIFKRYCKKVAFAKLDMNDLGSCEMIGEILLAGFTKDYPDRHIEVEISEDGESGAEVSL